MKENYTISLKVFIFLISLAILHTLGRILGGLGLISDLFTVLGAYLVWKNVKTSEARQRVISKVDEVIDVEDLGELLSNKTKQLKDQVKKIKTPSDIPAFDLDALFGTDDYDSKTTPTKPFTSEQLEGTIKNLDIYSRPIKEPEDTNIVITDEQREKTQIELQDLKEDDVPENPPIVKPGISPEYSSSFSENEDTLTELEEEDLDEFLEQDGSGI